MNTRVIAILSVVLLAPVLLVSCAATRTKTARYDPPFQLPFLRRNEVLVPVK